MNFVPRSHAQVVGIVCLVLGFLATTRLFTDLYTGSVDAVDYHVLLFPLGIAMLSAERLWRWVARIHLSSVALVTLATVVLFLSMEEASRDVIFELNDNIGTLSGAGIILLSHAVFLAAVFWIYFSIFAGPGRDPFELEFGLR